LLHRFRIMNGNLLDTERRLPSRHTSVVRESIRKSREYQAITRANIEQMPQWQTVDPHLREVVKIISLVFPFLTNRYVTDQLIDWRRIPDDPIYQLTFPQEGMLSKYDYRVMRDLTRRGASNRELQQTVTSIQDELNPHPAGQLTDNVPQLNRQP